MRSGKGERRGEQGGQTTGLVQEESGLVFCRAQ